MADYFPLLSRAVAGKAADEREAIYLRARAALERQLRGFDPPLEDLSIKAELDALEAVIVAVEREQLEAEHTEQAWQAGAEPVVPDTDAALDAPGVRAGADKAAPEPAAETMPQGLEEPFDDPLPFSPVAGEKDADDPAPSEPVAMVDALDSPAQDGDVPAIRPTLRPRVPVRDEVARPRKRIALFAGLALAAILVMGLIALSQRDSPGWLQAPTTPPVATRSRDEGPATEGPKTEGRLAGTDQAPRTPEPQPVPQPSRPPEPQRQASVEQPQGNGAVPAPAATTSRAFMVLESGAGSPSQFEGLAAWSFAPDPALQGTRSLKTIVAFPQANLTIDIGLARNSDPAVNASHTIMVVFDSGGVMEAVREMSPIEWRERETQSGQVLGGIVVPVQDNVFMIGLDRAGGAPQRNLDILRVQRWMVFEVRLANGRRGAVLVEKGAPGDKAVAEALAEWR